MDHFRKIDLAHIKQHVIQSSRNKQYFQLSDLNARFWLHQERVNFEQIKAIYKLLGNIQNIIIPSGEYKGLYFFSEEKNLCYKYEN